MIVLVVDGLGWHQLRASAGDAPFLASAPGRPIDAVAPTTTVAGLASIATGRTPGRHGLVGYTVAHPAHDQPFNLLVWRVGMRGGGHDARTSIVPEAIQPEPTAFERAQEAGVDTTVVVHPDFLDSGLTRAALRGGRRVPAAGLVETLAGATAHVDGTGPHLVYAHHGDVDTAGHVHGPFSEAWRSTLREVDGALTSMLRGLPEDVTVLVTSDHGMIEVPPDDVLEVSEIPELLDGVRVLAGEPRLRQLGCHPGAADEVAGRWREALGEDATVLTREAAVAAGWFGPEVHERTRSLLGDVLVAMHRGTVVHERVDTHGGRHRGQHGSLTTEELEVPLLLLRGGTT